MLTGEKVRLRAIEREDLPNYVRWMNDSEAIMWTSHYRPLSLAAEEQWFQDHVVKGSSSAVDFAIEHAGRHVGGCGLELIDHRSRNAELGIFIGEKQLWSQGLGTDAIRLLLQYGFGQLNLHRICLRVAAGNARAIRCYEKCGFWREGVLRDAWFRNGRYHDILIMSVLEGEWREASKPPSA